MVRRSLNLRLAMHYSFAVKSGKTLYEVGVDAETGKVLENAKEGKHPD